MVETFSVDVLRPLPLGEGWGEGLDGHNNPFVSSCPTLRPSPLAPLPAGEGNSEPSLLHELTARATERRRHRRLKREAVNDQSVHNVAPNQHQHGDCIFVADRLDH